MSSHTRQINSKSTMRAISAIKMTRITTHDRDPPVQLPRLETRHKKGRQT